MAIEAGQEREIEGTILAERGEMSDVIIFHHLFLFSNAPCSTILRMLCPEGLPEPGPRRTIRPTPVKTERLRPAQRIHVAVRKGIGLNSHLSQYSICYVINQSKVSHGGFLKPALSL
jgi:hypothetical protein